MLIRPVPVHLLLTPALWLLIPHEDAAPKELAVISERTAKRFYSGANERKGMGFNAMGYCAFAGYHILRIYINYRYKLGWPPLHHFSALAWLHCCGR
jgi:hypothetical protein